jgi:hypothetical protein
MFSFPFDFFSSEPEEVTSELFGAAPFDFKARWSNPSLLVNLCIYTVCKFFFTSVAAGSLPRFELKARRWRNLGA